MLFWEKCLKEGIYDFLIVSYSSLKMYFAKGQHPESKNMSLLQIYNECMAKALFSSLINENNRKMVKLGQRMFKGTTLCPPQKAF